VESIEFTCKDFLCVYILAVSCLFNTHLVDWDRLFSLPKNYWIEDVMETKKFFDEQAGCDLPQGIVEEPSQQEARITAM